MTPGAHGLAQQPVIIVEACIQEHVIRMSKVPAQTSFLLKLITDRGAAIRQYPAEGRGRRTCSCQRGNAVEVRRHQNAAQIVSGSLLAARSTTSHLRSGHGFRVCSFRYL